jgi:uncharacterized protein
MADALYEAERTCKVCENKFNVTKVRSRLITEKQDSDFCMHYRDVNPYYYSVWVCPNCGYAAQEAEFGEISSTAVELVKKFLAGREVSVDFSGIRTREQAIATYKLAIFFAGLTKLKNSKLAGLYLRLGWLYREGEQAEEEQLALAKAAELYDAAMAKERFPIDGMSELNLLYLVGELLRRTGKAEQSLLYFNKVVSNPQAKFEKRLMDMARDAWHEAREERDRLKRLAGEEVSEEQLGE